MTMISINKNITEYINEIIGTYEVLLDKDRSHLIKILEDIKSDPNKVMLHIKHSEKRIRNICRAILISEENNQ